MADVLAGDWLSRAKRDIDRTRLRALHGLKVVSGIGRPQAGASSKDVVLKVGKAELWRYHSDQRVAGRKPLLIVHSLVSRSYLFDLGPGDSFVQALVEQGFDVYLVNWGEPDELDAHNTYETYCDVLMPQIVSACLETSKADSLDLFGYCLGGVLALLYLAGHVEAPVASLTTMATPIDFDHAMLPFSTLVKEGRVDLAHFIDSTGNIPSDVVFNFFRVITPTAELDGYAALWPHLWNDEFVKDFQRMAGWSRDQVPIAGAVALQTQDLFVVKNLLTTGRVPLGGRQVEFADIAAPFLNIAGKYDHMVSPAANASLCDLVGSKDVEQFIHPTGHVGLIVGKNAQSRYIPALTTWLSSKSEDS